MNQQLQRTDVNRETGEIIPLDIHEPADLKLLDVYAEGGLAQEEVRIDSLATISAGYKVKKEDGKEYPAVSRDGIIHLHDPHNHAPGLKAALEAKGNKSLTIVFPFNNPAAFVQMGFREYTASRLLAYGDERGITTISDKGVHTFIPSGSKEYEAVKARCKLNLSIYFALGEWGPDGTPTVVWPKEDGLGLYRIRSTSRGTLRNLRAALDHVKKFTGGQIAGVPFDIDLEYRDVAGPDGSRRNVPCFCFRMRPPVRLSAPTLLPTLQAAVEQGRLLQLAPPRQETLADAEWEGPSVEDLAEWREIPEREVTETDARLTAEGGDCDARFYEALWFTTVRGTRFDSDVARADFVFQHSDGQFESLADYLTTLTNGEAESFIAQVSLVIQEETEAARRTEARARMQERLGGRSITEVMTSVLDEDPPPSSPGRGSSDAAELEPAEEEPEAKDPDDPKDEPATAEQRSWYATHYAEAKSHGLLMEDYATSGHETRAQLKEINDLLAKALLKQRSAQGSLL